MDFKYYISFGSRCHTSAFLKRNNLKKESYPFDWIYSNLNLILDCLKTNFKYFLDKQYYSIHDENSKLQTHLLYYPNGTTMFNHHNPLLEKDYNYFKRCICRLYNILKSDEKKLFMIIVDENEYNEYYSFPDYKLYDHQNDFVNFSNELKCITNNFELLIIFHKKTGFNYWEYTINDNITMVYFTTLSFSNGVEFINQDDNVYLDNIYTNIFNNKNKILGKLKIEN